MLRRKPNTVRLWLAEPNRSDNRSFKIFLPIGSLSLSNSAPKTEKLGSFGSVFSVITECPGLLETLIIAMFSYFRSAGDKIVETFQDLGYFERNEISNVKAKKIPGLELGSSSKNLKESMVSSSSESRTTTTAIEDIQKKPLIAIQCRRCLSDSSPVVIVNPCDHRFCVKCILFLWARQKQREPCVCPLDGEKIIWLRPPMLDEPEEISGLVDIYNPLFNPYHIMDMAEAQLVRSFTRFYCADLTLIIMGAIAYYFKISKSKASGT